MPTLWGDVADVMESRARRLGVQDDIVDLLLAAYNLLQQYVDQFDLAAYTVQNDAMFVTQPGARSCPLPDDFGRLLHTRDEVTPGLPGPGSSGLFVRGSTTDRPLPLQYRETLAFRQLRTLTHSRPQYFTFAQEGGQRTLVLDPPPDTNAGTNYTGEGVYIARVERPDLEDQVLLDEPTVIVAGVLAQIAGDRGLTQAQSLTAEYRMLLSAMVNNQARQRTKMYSQRWPVNRAYTR